MKKILYLGLGLLILSFGNINVKAACTNAEKNLLSAKAVNISYRWEPATKRIDSNLDEDEVDAIEIAYIQLHIYNLSDDLKIEVSNTLNKDRVVVTSDDAVDGIVTLDVNDISQLQTYTFKVYAKDSTCSTELISTSDISLPKYNNLTYYEMCNTTPDFYLCQDFINVDKTFEEFVQERDNYLANVSTEEESKEKEKGFFNGILSFLNKYKFVIIGVVVIAGVGTFIVVKKKGKRVV